MCQDCEGKLVFSQPYILIRHSIKVQFLGEEGEDGGGPSREFWSLLAKDVSESLFEGRENAKVLRHDSLALQVCTCCIPMSSRCS